MSETLLIVAGYLAGSLPFGYWLVALLKRQDIRKFGSGNIGATNVWRSFGPGLGAPVILLDVAKGFVPTLVATQLEGALVGALVGGAAMLGHWRPLFMRFQRGGKMVATAGGVTLALAPLALIGCVVVWVAVFVATRYASVASSGAAFGEYDVAYAKIGEVVAGEPGRIAVTGSLRD